MSHKLYIPPLAAAAKAAGFGLGEDVLRASNRLGVDARWLGRQADDLPGYGDDAVVRTARLMSGTLRDHAKSAALQGELTTLSEQLANTYEELSLIYQVSSEMKVNRRAGEFFKQTYPDALDGMNVRGL